MADINPHSQQHHHHQQQQSPPPPQPPQPPPSPPQQQKLPPQQQPPPPLPLPPQQQQQQQLPFRQLQQQQQQQLQAAMARFPSNIDAHLRPLGAIRSMNPNPNPNPNPVSLNPNLTSLQHNSKVNRTPPQLDVWRHQSDLKRPFDLPERDKVTDDAFFTVRDRKVRISDSNAIYALCRSWLRNGYHEESQPQHSEVLKSLPKPLPVPESSPEKKTTDNELDGEDVNVTATTSAEELLRGHIKRAKRVRERLREERLRRIKRYKSRLKLLLPPPIEQCRGDTAPS